MLQRGAAPPCVTVQSTAMILEDRHLPHIIPAVHFSARPFINTGRLE